MKRRPFNGRDDWMTPQEVGQLLGFSAQFIRNEIKAGELKAELIWSLAGKLGRYRIRRDDADAYGVRLRQRSSHRP